jgi:membrane-associated phospholipid phosphatase
MPDTQETTPRKVRFWWKLLRPEVFFLFIIPTVALILVASLGMLNNRHFGRDFWVSLLYMRFFGWQVFHVLCFVGLGYLAFSGVVYWMQLRQLRLAKSGKSSPGAERVVERFRTAKNFAGLVVIYAYALAANVVAMNALCCPKPARVEWANDCLMRADRMIFGTFVPFEMHEQMFYAGLATPLLQAYLSLSLAISLVMVALLIFRVERFRQYVLAFVAIMYLCMPGWAALPATTPSEGYRTGKLKMTVPIDIATEIADPVMNLNYNVVRFLHTVEPYESNPPEGRYFITSFPSLHVAWGVLVVWFGVELCRRSIILLLPWGLLNCIGAIYSLQHYAVDAVAGMIVTVATVYLVRGLVKLEARHGMQMPKGYCIAKFIQEDLVALGQAVWPSARGKARGRHA